MVKQHIFLECFGGERVDELYSLIDELVELNREIFVFYKYDIKNEYIFNKHQNIKVIKNKDTHYYEILYSAEFVFMNTNLLSNLNFKKTNGQVLIQLWHGVPLKYIGHDVKYSQLKESDFNTILDHELSQTNHLLVPNEFCEPIFRSAFKLPQSINILKSGYPRNDYYFSKNFALDRSIFGDHKHKKIVYYAPTWNDKDLWSTFKFVSNFDKLIEETQSTHFYILSFHPGTKNIFNFNPNSDNWIINENNNISNVELFNLADCLITDFSSVMFDFAITNKPIINFFTKQHYKAYIENRGIYFDLYEEGFNIANDIDKLKTYLNGLENLDNAINKYAPIKKYSAKDIVEQIGIDKANFVHKINDTKSKTINLNFNNKKYIKNETIFKAKFKVKRFLLKFRRHDERS